MGFKTYFVQLYGFLVKVFTQRWRSPVASSIEILLPLLFTLLLSIGYWTSDTTTVNATSYDYPAFSYDLMASTGFCTLQNSTTERPVWPPCDPALPPFMFKCLDLVGSGKEVCMPMNKYGKLMGLLFPAVYYLAGPTVISSMDSYLTMSALVTELARKDNPTFFGRSGRASMAHYGKLLIVSDDTALADEFMTFCRKKSAMCGRVLHPTTFGTMSLASDYATSHAPHVWAILRLPKNTLTATVQTEFGIRMNFTATADTSKKSRKSPFTRGLGDSGAAGFALYTTSGFLTLQNFVQQFFLQRRLANTTLVKTGPAIPRMVAYTIPIRDLPLIPMPTPERYDNAFLTQWAYYLPLVAMMAALFPVARLTSLVVDEKAKGIREAMLIMGLRPTCMYAGWYCSSLVIDIVASLLAAMMLKVGFMQKANYGVLLVVYFSFMQQNTAFAVLISTLFSNPRIASWCAAFLLFICAIPYYSLPDHMAMTARICVNLVPCIGYGESVGIILNYISFGQNFNWTTAHTNQYCVAVIIGMMWASFFLMSVLALYLDRVAPAAVGRRAHPLFFLAPLFRLCRKDTEQLIPMTSSGRNAKDGEPFGDSDNVNKLEKPAENTLVEHREDLVSTRDPEFAAIFYRLRKVYICGGLLGFFYTYFTGLFRRGDYVVALDDVTFAMKTGEVSVLLGANGAGKSTIMSIATGMVRPTSGDVYIRGFNASYDLNKCRQNIGYCPQSDIVWSSLTVAEHLAFYARLKGPHSFNVDKAVSKVIDLVGLEEKRDCFAGELSGGQRRRLCVGVALVGDSPVLFLDEPTAGMDVKGRRSMYQILNRARAERSVLLSTHLLDEADRIGDRILIVNEGKLCAEGSSMYLKSQMKVGYIVTCVVESGFSISDENMIVSELLDFVRDKGYDGHQVDQSEVQAVPHGCKLLGVERRGREVSFRFPLSLLSMSGASLLGELRANSEQLHLRSIGLYLTTLEDVFMTVTQNEFVSSSNPVVREEAVTGVVNASDVDLESDKVYPESGGFIVFIRHFRAMFMKRCHAGKRDARLIFFQVVLPILFLSVSFLITLISSPRQPAKTLDMTMYDNYATDPGLATLSSGALLDGLSLNASKPIPAGAPGQYYKTEYIPGGQMNAQVLSPYLTSTLNNMTNRRFFALSSASLALRMGNLTNTSDAIMGFSSVVLHNASHPHSAPQALSSLYNLGSYQLWGDQVPYISVRNEPMELGTFEKEMYSISKQVLMGIFVLLAFVLIPSNTISYIVREKESGSRHMQLLSGASVVAYWLSSFVFDALCFIGTEILAFVIFRIFNRTEFINANAIGPAIVMFFFYGITSIVSGYVLSFFFKSPFAAQTVVLLANFVMGFLWVMVEDMLLGSALNFVKYFNYIVRVFPSVCFGEGIFILSGNQLGQMLYPSPKKVNLWGFLSLEGGRFSGGVGTGLVYMACVFVGCVIVLVVLEYMRIVRVNQRLFYACHCCVPKFHDDEAAEPCTGASGIVDTSVAEEEQRVCADEHGPETDRIAVQHLSKHFFGSPRPAVSDVSLGVHEGEVMGLLGFNGAGKTTLMSMITGEVDATSGSAFVNHISVLSAKSRSFVGYCPQYDMLLDGLTPIEHLWLYARLRGMREDTIKSEVKMLINNLGLRPHRYKTAHSLSGGNKRRLSLAIALVGRTTSVLLDEPTAGMDAVARRQTCLMIRQLTKQKSVILTTHLLDEAEALADRVAFMARGELRSVGTPQELKGMYTRADEYTMGLQFPSDVHLESGDIVENVRRHVLSILQQDGEKDAAAGEKNVSCEVEAVQSTSLILAVRGGLPGICTAMVTLQEGAVKGVPAVTYVSVDQPTLEDILLLE